MSEATLPGEPLGLQLGTYFALSPDGRRLAYVAGKYASRRLYLRSLDRLEADELANVEYGSTPFFSPDGNWVGFHTPTVFRKIPATGGADRDAVPCDRRSRSELGARRHDCIC